MTPEEFQIQREIKVKPFNVTSDTLEKINEWDAEKIDLVVPLPIVANLYVLSIIASLSIVLSRLLKNNCDVEITFLLLTEQTNHSKMINNDIKKHIKSITNHDNSFALTENIRTAEFKSLINIILLSLAEIKSEGIEMISSKVTYIDIDVYIEQNIDQLKIGKLDDKKIDEYLKTFIQNSFLFIWDEIPGNYEVDKRFKNSLKLKLDTLKLDTSWIQNATIKKIDNDNTIKLSSSNEEDILLLSLNNDDKKVRLKMGDIEIDNFMKGEKNDELKLEMYGEGYCNCYFNQLLSIISHLKKIDDSKRPNRKKIVCINDDLSDIFNVDLDSDNLVLLSYPNPIQQKTFEKMDENIPVFVTVTSKYINCDTNYANYIDEFHFSELIIKLNSELFKSVVDIRSEYAKKIGRDDYTEDEIAQNYFEHRMGTLKNMQEPINETLKQASDRFDQMRKSRIKLVEVVNNGFLKIQNDTVAELKYLL